MVVSLKEQVKVRYEKHRHSYIQSVVLFGIMTFVTAMAVIVWFIMDDDASFSAKICASYIFLAVDFSVVIGKDTFIRTLYMLRCACDMRPMNHFVSSTLFFILAIDVMASSVLCAGMEVLGIEIGAFGIIHIVVSYIPMALITLVVYPNRLCDLIRRRRRVSQLKKHACFEKTRP